MNPLIFLIGPLVACLILTGIHTYLGIHVIARGVIFVDIALAQSAALGLTLALVFGFEPDSQMAYVFALGLTSLTAIFFATFKDKVIPQEAIIGVSFAVFSAMSILLMVHVPHGAEHLQYLLSGNILWVTWPQIIKTALIYSVLGIIHYGFRRQFLWASMNATKAKESGLKITLWDMLFYLSFGLVITSSVQMGGILLVFSFLIVPALCSMLFYENLKPRIILGWLLGMIASLAGLALSFYADLPTGPTIVGVFGLIFLVALIFRPRKLYANK